MDDDLVHAIFYHYKLTHSFSVYQNSTSAYTSTILYAISFNSKVIKHFQFKDGVVYVSVFSTTNSIYSVDTSTFSTNSRYLLSTFNIHMKFYLLRFYNGVIVGLSRGCKGKSDTQLAGTAPIAVLMVMTRDS